MQKYSCLIIEDEPIAAEIIESYIQKVPFLELIAKCEDAIDALEIMRTKTIDLLFLDLHLPELKGFDFLKTLNSQPKVIVTTAYHQYALQSYEYNVIDYLLKPIQFDRFISAVNKLPDAKDTDNKRGHLFFNVNHKMVKVFFDEILYIESTLDYINIISKTKKITTKYQLGEIEKILENHNFIRVHRSFIVSLQNIEAYTATDIEINGYKIPIGRNYKEQVSKLLP